MCNNYFNPFLCVCLKSGSGSVFGCLSIKRVVEEIEYFVLFSFV